MFKFSILLFFRNLHRQKLTSLILILGLTVGITSALLTYLFVKNELSYDRFHENADRIYRVNQTFIWGEGNDHQFASTGPGVSFALEAELPEVEQVVRIHTPGDYLMSYTNSRGQVTSIDQDHVLAADSNFFQVFTFPLIKGDPRTALVHPQTMVITQSTAAKYFGEEDPMGKMIRLGEGDQQKNYEVTGIIRDIPDNSYLQFDVMLSMTSFPVVKRLYWSWIWTQVETYVLFHPGFSIEQARARLKDIPRKYAATTLERAMNMSFDDYIRSGKKWDLYLQPLTDIHLPEEIVYNRISDVGNIKVIYALIAAGIIMILLSCINFMNLSTAQYLRKGKETAVRKILGSASHQLSLGFFTEAVMYCLLSLIIGLSLAQLSLPLFNLATGKHFSLDLTSDWSTTAAMASLMLVMSLLAGVYPAVFLSAFKPVDAMKGKLKTGSTAQRLRNGMVVFQFVISIALISFTGVVSQQLKFSYEKDLGFDKSNLLVVERAEWTKAEESFAAALNNAPGVTSVSWCTSVPPNTFGGDKFNGDGSEKNVALNFTEADENYLPTMGIRVAAGRNFSKSTPADSGRVILNQKAVAAFGWTPEEAIGKRVRYPGSDNATFEVIGIMEDFHYWSILTPIEPFAVFHIKARAITGGNKSQYIVLKIQSQNSDAWKATLAGIENTWRLFAADHPFQYTFVEQDFAEAFRSTERFGQSLSILSGLAILIASLGLLGMIMHTLENRTKEIGIRKVAGASVSSIIMLIARDYSRLIMIAFILSTPLAWFGVQLWLQDFEYRITPSPITFVISGAAALAIAFLVTSYHSIKAARRNPVEVLRTE